MNDTPVIETTIEVKDRSANSWLIVAALLDKLGWSYYPTHTTGEDIDAGDDSDAAQSETIAVPVTDTEIFDLLDSCGVFDYC